jgi:hypothetical protein
MKNHNYIHQIFTTGLIRILFSFVSCIFTLCLLLCLTVSTLSAQSDKIILKLYQPPPNKMGMKDIWKLSLENRTKAPVNLYLEGNVTETKDGLLAVGKSRVISVKPGITLLGYDDFKGGSASWKNKKYEEIIMRTGNAPSGEYTICITAFNEEGDIVGEETCIEHSQSLISQEEITLIMPEDNEELEKDQLINFMWSPLSKPPSSGYVLKVVQILGKQTVQQALKENRPVILEKNIRSTSFACNKCISMVGEKSAYAWRVELADGSGVMSDAAGFVIKSLRDVISGGSATSDTFSIQCLEWNENTGFPQYRIKYRINNFSTSSPGQVLTYTDIKVNGVSITSLISPTTFPFSIQPPPYIPSSRDIEFNWSPTTFTSGPIMIESFGRWGDILTNTANLSDTIKLPSCICKDCDSVNITLDNFQANAASPGGHVYNLQGNINYSGLPPIYGVEFQVLHHSFSSEPQTCTQGVTSVEESGMFLSPSSINGSSSLLFMNENISTSGNSNQNASKTIRYQSATPLASGIPFQFSFGLPRSITGLNDCCVIKHQVCLQIKVYYDKDKCSSCIHNQCIEFTNSVTQ